MIDRPKGLDQFDRRLLSDSGDPGDIVNGVSCQAHHLHDLVRPYTEALDDLLLPEPFLLHGVINLNPVAYQLEEVLVSGDDHHIDFRFQTFCHGPDEIIGLIPLHLQCGYAITSDDLLDIRNLRNELLRHSRPVGLIGLKGLAPEGRRLRVEDNGKIVGPVIFEHLEKHLDKPVNRVGRKAF